MRQRIIDFACLLKDAHSQLDLTTTLHLFFASTGLSILAARSLYQTVSLTRPSSLASFCRSLAADPRLRHFVQSLHVGPQEPLNSEWHPLIERDDAVHGEEGTPYFASVRSSLDWVARPAWCGPEKRWSLASPEAGCRGRAIFVALLSAQEALDIDLELEKPDVFVGYIDTPTWLMRCFSVQAALDIYLEEMKRIEEMKRSEESAAPRPCQCEHGSCPSYPGLRILGNGTPPSATETLVLTQRRLLQHHARRRSVTRHFDLPAKARAPCEERKHRPAFAFLGESLAYRLHVALGETTKHSRRLVLSLRHSDPFASVSRLAHISAASYAAYTRGRRTHCQRGGRPSSGKSSIIKDSRRPAWTACSELPLA